MTIPPRPRVLDTNEVIRQMRANVSPDYTRRVVTVAELRARLDAFPDEAIVVLAKDAEGNSHSPLRPEAIDAVLYYPESTWSGWVYGADTTRGTDAVLVRWTNGYRTVMAVDYQPSTFDPAKKAEADARLDAAMVRIIHEALK